MTSKPAKPTFLAGLMQGLLLALLAFATLAAVSPGSPPVRLVAGAGMTIITNALNSFTLSSSGGSGTNAFNTNQFAVANGTNVSVKAGPLLTNAIFAPSAASTYVTEWLNNGGTTAGYVSSNGTLSWQGAVSLTNTGNTFVGNGTGLTNVSANRPVVVDTTASAGVEDTTGVIQSNLLSASWLLSAGSGLAFVYSGQFSYSEFTKTATLWFGTNKLILATLGPWGSGGTTYGDWMIRGTITTTASGQKCEAFLNQGQPGLTPAGADFWVRTTNTVEIATNGVPLYLEVYGVVTKEIFRLNYEPAP